jgi:hypothetical protein
MGYQPRTRSPKGSIHEQKKPLREKGKDSKRIHRRNGRPIREEKHTATEREVSELTLKQLHTLGGQKFGSSPFSQHFDRWLANVGAVVSEFELHPNMSADDQFVRECSQILFIVKLQLEDRRLKEASLDQEIRNLSGCRNRLEQINSEYVTLSRAIRIRKNAVVRPLNSLIVRLKRDQTKIIQMKTGFFRGVSRKSREQKEIAIVEELNDKQRELELVILDFIAQQKAVREEYERKRELVLEQIKCFRKITLIAETDGSLEERWFACEALIDAVNSFLQRKATEFPRNA